MTDQLLENTILLFVAVDPIALIPIFASLTKGLKNQEIKKIYIQATFVSLIILSLFWLFGETCLLYTSPSPRDRQKSRMPSSA